MIYNFVATVKSHSNPDKFYTIKMRHDGLLTCNCPSWIYNQRGNRTCKHIDEVKSWGFSADHIGKLIVGEGNWGNKVPVFCNNYPTKCDGCSLRFVCFTSRHPEFTKDQLKSAGVIT